MNPIPPETMTYSETVAAGLIRPRKSKYTKRDVDAAQLDSLFRPYQGRTLTRREAVFVVKCSAIYHGTDYANRLA